MSDGATSVLDASALLAHLNDEVGADVVENAILQGAAISAVNLTEVLSKLAEVGEDPGDVIGRLHNQGLLGGKVKVLPLSEEDAVLIARLHGKTRDHGLSLGDRACLALALRLRVPAVTADRAWTRLRAGITVRAIR